MGGPGLSFTIFAFLLVIGPLVFVHELGHYFVGRWFGVHAETFSIGFGPELMHWTDKRGTRWRVGALPLGGYVKLHGQETPEDVSPETRAGWLPGRTFHEKPVGPHPMWSYQLAFAPEEFAYIVGWLALNHGALDGSSTPTPTTSCATTATPRCGSAARTRSCWARWRPERSR